MRQSRILKFDEKIALEVFSILDRAWKTRNEGGIFQETVLPQDQYAMPDDPKACVLLLFYLALTQRGGIISEDPFKIIHYLWKECPDLFIPRIVASWAPERVEKILRSSFVPVFGNDTSSTSGYKIAEHARSWIANSFTLHRYWGDDPRNVFWGCPDFEEAFRRIDYKRAAEAGFRGMRRKIFTLYTIWLQEKELINYFPTPIPVDFHAMRVLWACEIINCRSVERPFAPKAGQPESLRGKACVRVSERFVNEIMQWSQRFIWENGFSHLRINPALWDLSRRFCAEHVQNGSRGNGMRFIESDSLRDIHGWPRDYKNPCGFCPVEKYCKWAIPASPYYRWGVLVRVGKRMPYPCLRLPGIVEWGMVPFSSRKKSGRPEVKIHGGIP